MTDIMQSAASCPQDNEIPGVYFKQLVSHRDDRGFFREICRVTEPVFQTGRFAQWSHSKMVKDVVKAWHYHHLQNDWWYVPFGQVQTALIDNREESPTYRKKLLFKMGDSSIYGPDTFEICVRIPPGVLHGCRVLSEQAHLFYITSETYNPQDEGRFPYNSELIDHNWGPGALTVENDRRVFVPPHPRRKS